MKAKSEKKYPKGKKNRKISLKGIFALLVIAAFVLVYVVSNRPLHRMNTIDTHPTSNAAAPAFELEGKLIFWGSGQQPVAEFMVEIADDAYSREKGMMHRYYIPDTVGMLFIFPQEDHRFFWMKDTPSSLDIIYADKEFRIVSIHENTPPHSLETIPSGDKAKYVIELKAGSVARFELTRAKTFSYQVFE
jgi:uncharacterized protein